MKNNLKKKHIISILVVGFFVFLAFGSGESEKKNSDGTVKTERQILIEKQFSAWDGSHPELERMIKDAMNDPDSYEHIETVYWDLQDHLVIRTTYSGKNAFGGRVKNWVKAKVDFYGNVLEIIDEGS